MGDGVTRRSLLGGAVGAGAMGAVGLLGGPWSRGPGLSGRSSSGSSSTTGGRGVDATTLAGAPVSDAVPGDPRVQAIVDLSRDARGRAHVQRVAILDGGEGGEGGRATGTLPVSDTEAADLLHTLASGDFTAFQARGLRLDGRKFVFVKSDDDGTVLHAVRPGEFVTLRAAGDTVVVATRGPDMAHGRAVEAVYQALRRDFAPARGEA